MGSNSPKLIVVFQGINQFIRLVFTQNYGRINGSFIIPNFINSTVGIIPQISFISIADPHIKSIWFWVMLNDITVPIRNPNCSVGTHFRKNGRYPFIGTRQEIKALNIFIIGAFFLHHVLVNYVSRWFTNEGSFVPIFLRKSPCRVEIMPCGGGIATPNVHLTNPWRDGLHILVRIRATTPIICR